MSDPLKVVNEIKSDDEVFNGLVNETIKIMKAEIIQSVMNRHDSSKFHIATNHEMLKKDLKSMDDGKKAYIRFNPVNSGIISKYSKLVKNNLDMEEMTSVGDVVANRFSHKPSEIKIKVIKNIEEMEKIDFQTFKDIKSNNYTISNGPPIIRQVNLEERFPQLVQEKYFIKLIESPLTLKTEIHGPIQLFSGAKLATPLIGKYPGTVAKLYEKTKPGRFLDKKAASRGAAARRAAAEKAAAEKAAAEKTAAEKAIKSVELKLHRVKCVDETGSNWFTERGSDEINMGGVTLDNKEIISQIKEFKVGNFDDGTNKLYNPPKILRTFTGQGSTYPKIFTGYISLAEKDSGGFSSFISDLYKAIKDELDVIIVALGVAAGAIIGGNLGGTLGSLAGPIGTVIGIAAGAVLGAVISWLVNAFKDDIFTPQMSMLSVDLSNPGSGTVKNSPISTLTYREHDATYKVDVSWTVRY